MIRRLPALGLWLAAAAAAASVGLAAGPVAWRSGASPVADAAPGNPPPAPRRIDLGPVLAFAPFGRADAPVAAAPAAIGETSLGLTLLGVTLAVPESASRALIADARGRAESHAVGGQVTPDAVMVAVASDHILLQIGDKRETLSFPQPGSAPPGSTSGPNLRNLIGTVPASQDRGDTSDAPEAVIARYRAAIHQNAQGVMDRLGLELTGQGYRITDRASPGVRQAGFRPGDVVTTVNGQKVGEVNRDRAFFDEIAASGRARVEVQRDGQAIIMSFPLR